MEFFIILAVTVIASYALNSITAPDSSTENE